MSTKKSNLKPQIRQYILNIGGLLKEELDDPRFEFVFMFFYPNKNGRLMRVAQQKNKNFIEISIGTPFSPEHKKGFTSLEKRDQIAFIKRLQKILFRAELNYSYDLSKHHTIVLIDKIFIEGGDISLNLFFNSVRKAYSATMSIIFYIQDFFSDEFDPADFILK